MMQVFRLFLHQVMSVLYYSYHFLTILDPAGFVGSGLQAGSGLNPASPYRYILYCVILIALVYLLARSQTKSLVKTMKLLKSKDQMLEEVQKQKAELEIREQNTTESLNYAQRIQEALLPSEDYFRKYFRDSFIFFKPKNIVSGDFYWIGE